MEDLSIFVDKDHAGKLGTYIIRSNTIEIVSIERIGEFWLMKLSRVSISARSDIYELLSDQELGSASEDAPDASH